MSTLQSFVDRIENLDAEQKSIGTDKRDVFDEAAEAGFDKKAIRRLLRDRREAAKDKGTAELAEQYRMLLSEPGATYRSVAEKTGVPLATLHRRAGVPRTEKWNTETRETAAVKQPGGDSRHDRQPDGPGSVAANPIEEVPPGGGASTVKMGHGIPDPGLGDAAIGDATGRDELGVPSGRDAPSDEHSTVPAGEVAGNTGGGHDGGLTTLGRQVARVVPAAHDLPSCGGDILSTPPPGAVAEAEPKRVAPHNPDWIDSPPAFLDRRQRVA